MRPLLRPGLSDVMQQCCQAQGEIARRRSVDGREGVIPDVERVPLVLLHADAFEELRPEMAENAGLAQELQADRWLARLVKELGELILDALGRDRRHERRRGTHRLAYGRRGVVLEA